MLTYRLLRLYATIRMYQFLYEDWMSLVPRVLRLVWLLGIVLPVTQIRRRYPTAQWALWGMALWPVLYFVFRLYFG